MNANPMIRPIVISVPLILASVVIGPCLIYAASAAVANWPAPWWFLIATAILLAASMIVVCIWIRNVRRSRRWDRGAHLKWRRLAEFKAASGTTTEVTIVSIDDVQPTGAWATVRWNKFGYIQQAWLESGPFAYWPAAVLLITPDPMQVQVGQPWPNTYWLRPRDCLAIAPVTAGSGDYPTESATRRSAQKA